MVSTRTAGKRGRLPAKTGADKLAIGWVHEYLATPLPAPAYPVDISGGIVDWGMLGNGPDPTCTTYPNGLGDCTFAGREHAKRAKAAAGHETEPWETSDALVAEYLAYDHGQDVGANIADLLLAWYKAGKILGFAPVDHTDPAACDSAMAAFHGLYAGVNLTPDADQLFSEGATWSVGGGSQPDPADGHCIVKVGAEGLTRTAFDDATRTVTDVQGLDTWVTWGALQKSTLAWTAACLTEAWAIITQEDADAASLDIAALRADIDSLHGTGGNGSPAPAPVPVPDPHGLLAEVAVMAREIAAGTGREIHELVALLHSHGL